MRINSMLLYLGFFFLAIMTPAMAMENSFSIHAGSHAIQGRRPTMEDEHEYGPTRFGYFAGVYDGHGGTRVSIHLKSTHTGLLKQSLDKFNHITSDDLASLSIKKNEDIMKAINDSYVALDQQITARALGDGSWSDGSTAVNAYIVGRRLFIANAGDSEAIVVKSSGTNTEAIEMTTVHKPVHNQNSAERTRVEQLGGKVYYNRVFGMLAVSRAFGDIQYKNPTAEQNYVIAEPAISMLELDDQHKFVILACDGLWDVLDHKEAADIVIEQHAEGKNLDQIAQYLVDEAHANLSSDNISVVVIQLAWQGDKVREGAKNADPEKAAAEQNRSNKLNSIQKVESQEVPKAVLIKQPEFKLWLKSIRGESLTRSYCYLDENHDSFCMTKLGTKFELPGWVDQKFVSYKLFGDSGVRALKLAEAFYKRYFVWATDFSNVHTTFKYDEKPITIKGKTYAGPEQFFQLQKSVGTPDKEKAFELMKNATPDQAFGIGRAHKLRRDWEQVKDDVMFYALKAKFTQHKDAKIILLETEGHLLVQLKPNDSYWGTGPDGKGLNKHAEILMKIRKCIQSGEFDGEAVEALVLEADEKKHEEHLDK